MAYPVYSIWFDWKCLSNVNLIILTTCSPSRSLRCYTHLKLQAADNHFLSLTFAPPLKRGNHGMDVLILDLCEGIGESSALLSGKHCRPCSESDFTLNGTLSRPEVYKLVQDLHRFGILHGDLEPGNIACARGGE